MDGMRGGRFFGLGHSNQGRSGEGPRHGKIYGSTTVGERGQIVVPAEARKDLGFGVGQKIIVMSHGRGLLLLRADVVAQAVSESMTRLAELERTIAAEALKDEARDDGKQE